MEAAPRRLSDVLDTATQRLIDEARLLTGADLRAPSLLPGWSRAHVLAHLARGADAMRNLLTGSRDGRDRLAYPSAQAGDVGVDRSAAAGAGELAGDLADSAMALRTVARRLPDRAWRPEVRLPDGLRFPAGRLLAWRLAEVELHHCDLGIGYGPGQWCAAFAAMELEEPMRSWRAARLASVQPESVRARSMARKIPPYRAGQPLPGSWLSRR